MLFKIIVLFFVFIAVVAMFGKLRLPGGRRLSMDKCPHCERHTFGKPCQCRKRNE